MTPVMITVPDLAEQMGKDPGTVYGWAARDEDPLPLRYEKGTRRCGCIAVDEFSEWWRRNSVHYKEK